MMGAALGRFLKMYGPQIAKSIESGEQGIGKLATSASDLAMKNPHEAMAIGGAGGAAGLGLGAMLSGGEDPEELGEDQLLELLRKKGMME